MQNKFFCLITLSVILATAAYSQTKSYAASISDLNGTWLSHVDYKNAMKMSNEYRKEYWSSDEYSWGKAVSIPNVTFEIDITAEKPFVLEPGTIFYVTEMKKVEMDSIKVNAYHGDLNQPRFCWFIEIVFHFIDKDTFWIESKALEEGTSEHGYGKLWHRLSGPAS